MMLWSLNNRCGGKNIPIPTPVLYALKSCAIVLLAMLYMTSGVAHAEDVITSIEQAVLIKKSETKSVSLPYELKETDFNPSGDIVRFDAKLDLNEIPKYSLALYIERLSLSARVYINHQDIGSCGTGDLEKLRCRHQPLLLTIPANVLRAGVNDIEVELYTNSHQRDGLSKLLVGPTEYLLSNYYNPKYLWSHDFILATTWTTLSLGVIFLIIGFIQKSDPLYIWFGLASLLNALSSMNLLATHVWFDEWWTTWFIFSVRLSSAPITFLAILVYFRRDVPWMKYSLILYAAVAPLIIAISDNSKTVVLYLYAPMLVIVLVLLASTAFWSFRSKKHHEIAVTIMLYAVGLASIRDYIMMVGRSSFTNYYLASHTLAGMFIVMSGLIIKIIVDANYSSYLLNKSLKTQVAIFEESIVDKHNKLMALEHNAARVQERESLLREMHDGLGSNLALAKIRVSKGEMNQDETRSLLDDCIDDLRIILDSTDTEENFGYAIAKLRSRFNPRLLSSGIRTNWSVELSSMPDLSPQTRLNLMRIIQEGLTNSIRHSGATELQIHIEYKNGRLIINIDDNGHGFDIENKQSYGRGVENMHHRASNIGAQIDIISGLNGTKLCIKKQIASG